jgi:6-phosphofructokinase 1
MSGGIYFKISVKIGNGEKLKRIAVTTAGGDAPGMNACLRAIVRDACCRGLEVLGIEEGYMGLIENRMKPMSLRSVGGIINRGGTLLRTRRCEEIKTPEGLKKAAKTIEERKLDGLIAIGGDGSFRGGWDIYRETGICTVGIPASIDNDIAGTETTIGFDTAVNTALQAIDKIRDTAFSHERIFIVQVMGRQRGFLALEVGLVCGAEIILIPEIEYSLDGIIKRLEEGRRTGKRSFITVIAEGVGDPYSIADQISSVTKNEVRVTTLGYIQRGGTPTARSIHLASLFGYRAVERLVSKKSTVMMGLENGKIVTHPLDYPMKHEKKIDKNIYELAQILST